MDFLGVGVLGEGQEVSAVVGCTGSHIQGGWGSLEQAPGITPRAPFLHGSSVFRRRRGMFSSPQLGCCGLGGKCWRCGDYGQRPLRSRQVKQQFSELYSICATQLNWHFEPECWVPWTVSEV